MNKNDKKIIKNKKQLILLIISFVIVVIVCLVIVFVLLSRNKEAEDKIFKDLISKDYLASYILRGDVKIGDAYAEFDGIKYYAVVDDKLKNYNSMNKIMDIFDKYYEENNANVYLQYLQGDSEYNQYQEFNGVLYVLKKEPACQKFQDITDDYTQIKGDGTVTLSTSYYDINLVKVGKDWRLRSLDFYCQDAANEEDQSTPWNSK